MPKRCYNLLDIFWIVIVTLFVILVAFIFSGQWVYAAITIVILMLVWTNRFWDHDILKKKKHHRSSLKRSSHDLSSSNKMVLDMLLEKLSHDRSPRERSPLDMFLEKFSHDRSSHDKSFPDKSFAESMIDDQRRVSRIVASSRYP